MQSKITYSSSEGSDSDGFTIGKFMVLYRVQRGRSLVETNLSFNSSIFNNGLSIGNDTTGSSDDVVV